MLMMDEIEVVPHDDPRLGGRFHCTPAATKC
jgi:hypothetical protein